jgi:DNA polymerase-1
LKQKTLTLSFKFCTFDYYRNTLFITTKRLFLLDAYALIFRGYYAFIKNRINSKGMDTSAIMGFMNSLMDVIKRKPDHLAVAFDKGGVI